MNIMQKVIAEDPVSVPAENMSKQTERSWSSGREKIMELWSGTMDFCISNHL